MKSYEVVVILDPQKVEGNGELFSKGIEEQIATLNGTVTRVKCLDLRTFARPIKKRKAGIYYDYVVNAEGTFVAAIKDFYRLNSAVLRLVVFDYTAGQDDMVFAPTEGHESMIKEENFQDAYEREERPYGGRGFRD